MLRAFDNSKESDFIKFLSKYGDNADDIIERLSSGDGLAAKAVNSHFDDFVSCYDKYKTDFLKAFSTYPKYSDDILKLTDDFGQDFIKLINATHADEVGKQINLSLLESFRLDLINSGNNNISKVCVAFDGTNPLKRGISVNGSYFKNRNLLGAKEISLGADSILDSLYKAKYGDEAFKNITDYTDYYNLSMSDEYLDMLPDNYYEEMGINRTNTKMQMKKLRDSITNTKIDADNAKRYTDLPKIKEPSFQTDWRIENCAEVWSVRQAILNGADYDNIAFKCVDIKSNIYWAPCANCTKTFAGLIDLGKGE